MGVMVKEELCEKLVKAKWANDSDNSWFCFLRGCAEVDLWVC